jgi:four helix bundle protein
MIRDFQDLVVWQKSIDLATEVYQLTRKYPREELFGLVSQTRRAAVSVSSNIAEGSGRETTRDLCSFLTTSRSSLYESRSLLIVSQKVQILNPSDCMRAFAIMDEVGKMLAQLRTNLRARKPLTTKR